MNAEVIKYHEMEGLWLVSLDVLWLKIHGQRFEVSGDGSEGREIFMLEFQDRCIKYHKSINNNSLQFLSAVFRELGEGNI